MTDSQFPLQRSQAPANSGPFIRRALGLPSFIDRVFRRQRPDLAAIALENVLADAQPTAISINAVNSIAQRYHLTPSARDRVSSGLFAKAYRAVIADDVISDDEVTYLLALRRLLNIGEDTVIALERETILPRYQRAVSDAIADGKVTTDERAQLNRLAEGLRLSPAIREQIYREPATAMLKAALNERLADRRLSPDEFRTFAALASNIGVQPSFDAATERLMHRYALFWRIEHGDIPAIDAPIQLQRGELCHFQSGAQWLEHRKQTSTVGYSSSGVSVRVMRGVYYHVGASRPQRVTTEGLAVIETGTVYFTNKRVVFSGQIRNFSLRLNSLLAFRVYADGVVLEKATGKHPHLILDGDSELAAVVLGSLLGQSSTSA